MIRPRLPRARHLVGALGLLGLWGLSGCNESPNPVLTTTADPARTTTSPVATTQYGRIRGTIDDDILAFKGIRYGADTATTRFQAPRPPQAWDGIADALEFGNSARQASGVTPPLYASWTRVPAPQLSEDCLFLNVWTQALQDGGKRPVMVWLHGGGFSSGSGSSTVYEGTRLAQRGDVVVVTVNHRLNIFGHLYLAEYGERFADSGNAGILDLVLALEWVRDNIAAFGGDPNNVLIFGESGGGAKVSVLMAMDQAKGLFHRAVVQSGARLSNMHTATAAEGAAALAQHLGLNENNLDDITTLSPDRIEAAASAIVDAGGTATWSGPVYDGRNFTRQPFEPDAPPQSAEVPLLIGTTRTEMSSLLALIEGPHLFDLSWESLPEKIATLVPDADAQAVIAGYRGGDPSLTAPGLYFTAATDHGFLRRTLALADLKANQHGAPVYAYLFNWNTPMDGGRWLSPHGLDIGFVFDNLAKSESLSGTGDAPQRIADMMSEAWIAFARDGDPNHPGLPTWTPYTAEHRATMLIDAEPAVVNDPRGPYVSLLGP
jgi:para-nitrobenzyl esterase